MVSVKAAITAWAKVSNGVFGTIFGGRAIALAR